VYRYRLFLAETQFNVCGYWFSKLNEEQGARWLAKSRATLLQSLRTDPKNIDAADQAVRFTRSIAELLTGKKDFNMAERVLQEARQELLALQKESAEYSALSSLIETLDSSLLDVLEEREKAKQPADVA